MEDDVVQPGRLIFPGLAGLYNRFSPLAYALVRFSIGAVLVPHGVQKVFFRSIDTYADIIAVHPLPLPRALAYLTFFAESVAAACLALGLFPRPAALMIWIEM